MPKPEIVSMVDNDLDRAVMGLPSTKTEQDLDVQFNMATVALSQAQYNVVQEHDRTKWGLRSDGTPKGAGFFGVLQRPDGGISTELSIGVDFDGKQMEIPSLTPNLNSEEVDYLLSGGKVTPEIISKNIAHAKDRMSMGLSVYKEE